MLDAPDQERLISLLRQELELFGQVLENCEKQAELLSDNKIDELVDSLGKADKLGDKINGLHQDVSKLMQSAAQSDERNAEIDAIYAELKEIIEQCASLNDQNMNLLKAKTEEQSEKIDKQAAKRKGIGGYAQAVAYTPELFDGKS